MAFVVTSNILCRLCAELCKQDDNVFISEHKTLLDLVTKYLSIIISSDDDLPVNICETCRLTLKSFDEYVLRCQDTQVTLTTLHAVDNFEEKIAPKVEVKVELVEINEGLIKTEEIEFIDDGHDADDFCDEDFLPLITTLTKKRKRKSSRWSVTKKKTRLKEKKTIQKKEPKIKTVLKKDKIKKKDLVVEKKHSKFEESLSVQNSFFNFSCHVCKEKCNRFADLQNHTRNVHSEKAKVLCICMKYLRQRKQLLLHLLKHVDSFGIKCPVCPRKFVTDKYLAQHIETHNIEYKCTQCSKIFSTAIGVRIHEKSHIPVELRATYPCDICHAKFLNKTAVATHKNAVHENYKPYICDGCGKSFVTNGAMRAHHVIHDKEPTLTCPQCPKKFKVKAHLKRHLDYHNGVTFKCPECPALFNTKRTLTSHFMIHRDVYKFICGYCDKKFKWKSSFKSHINNHTGATPYKCDWCPKTFTDGPNCRIHKRRKHPVEVAESDAKRAAENPKAVRKETSIIKEIKVKNPTMEDAIIFPKIRKKEDDAVEDDTLEDEKDLENYMKGTRVFVLSSNDNQKILK